MRGNALQVLVAVFALAFVAPPAPAADWPAFRGPHGDGTTSDSGFPTEWSREKNVKWRAELPAPGNSSPIVAVGKVFVTCAEDRGRTRTLYCFDRNSGEQLWSQTVTYPTVELTHKTNPYCPTTPLCDGERVYVWHGSAGLHAYTVDGEPVWSRDLGEFRHIWGIGSSPILYKDMLIQLCGPGERTFVVALDRQTGETRWETPREEGGRSSENGRPAGTWITPRVVDVGGRDQLICAFHYRVAAFDPDNGQELWSVGGMSSDRGDLVYASPMIAGTNAVVMAGYGGPEFGFRLGGKGDVTDSNRLWYHEKSPKGSYHPQRIGTGVTVGDVLFMANADGPGSLECIDVKTGERRWTVDRTRDGPHWGSVVMAEGRLYVTGQRGVTHVFAADPDKYVSIAQNTLGEDSNSTPALSNGEIFLRTFNALYCISEK